MDEEILRKLDELVKMGKLTEEEKEEIKFIIAVAF